MYINYSQVVFVRATNIEGEPIFKKLDVILYFVLLILKGYVLNVKMCLYSKAKFSNYR